MPDSRSCATSRSGSRAMHPPSLPPELAEHRVAATAWCRDRSARQSRWPSPIARPEDTVVHRGQGPRGLSDHRKREADPSTTASRRGRALGARRDPSVPAFPFTAPRGRRAGAADPIVRGDENDAKQRGCRSTHARSEAGALFFAIRGPKHDGHAFTSAPPAEARAPPSSSIERGLDDLSMRLPGDGPRGRGRRHHAGARRTWRGPSQRASRGPLVGLTGSSGKTTTKEMCAAMSRRLRALPQEHRGNLNNEYGLPAHPAAREAEHAARRRRAGHEPPRRDRAAGGDRASPTSASITNVGTAHIEFLGSPRGDRRGEGRPVAALPARAACPARTWTTSASRPRPGGRPAPCSATGARPRMPTIRARDPVRFEGGRFEVRRSRAPAGAPPSRSSAASRRPRSSTRWRQLQSRWRPALSLEESPQGLERLRARAPAACPHGPLDGRRHRDRRHLQRESRSRCAVALRERARARRARDVSDCGARRHG